MLLLRLPGRVIVLDIPGWYQSPITQRLGEEAAGQLLFLPAYSPGMNSNEQLRNTFEMHRRKDLPTAGAPFIFVFILTRPKINDNYTN